MYRITDGSTHGLEDVAAFVETLNTLSAHPTPAARGLFEPGAELVVTRSPGRLDVIGGIADYSGSLVLQLPIREATLAAVQQVPERTLRIVSLGAEANDRDPVFEMPLADFAAAGRPITYEAARTCFQRDPRRHWAAYVAGALLVLMRERGLRCASGARILIASSVPEGQGVSSSAAIEVAVMHALAAAYQLTLDPRDLAILCQTVENLVVGAPCGVMDQMTASCGQRGRLLALLCQPAELQAPVELPDRLAVWGLDSGVRHLVSGADYASVRIGAFMGYRMIAERAGLKVTCRDTAAGPVRVDDLLWHGYLANVTPSAFEQRFSADLPERIRGDVFLDRYGGTTDTVTRVDPRREYAVRTPTAHPVYEHFRVCRFRELLQRSPSDEQMILLGELMYQSHASYSACGLGSAGTDRLVELVRQAGPARGLYGAKITGGGSGGTVAVLGRPEAEAAVREIAEQYAHQTGHRPHVFAGSSPGSAAFGHLKLQKLPG